MLKKIVFASAVAAFCVTSAYAAPVSVGVFGGSDGPYTNTVVDNLSNLGVFSSVTALTGNETVSELGAYSSILVYNNSAADYSSFGSTLADYVDAGGGLVAATFLYQTMGSGFNYGRLETGGYLPFASYSSNYTTSTLGNYDASDPIMQGVTQLSGYYRDVVTLSSDARLVASWADGAPLVAVDSSRVIGVFLFPNNYYGDVSGDYNQLFANALTVAAVPEPETYAMMIAGLAIMGTLARRKRQLPV